MGKLYNVKLTNIYYFETQVEAENFQDACDKADSLDWDDLQRTNDETEVACDGFEVEDVEEE
tara:strand:- start:201 stop:386 length:186 start_codon:yes stop_codon:yes gene_type:complete